MYLSKLSVENFRIFGSKAEGRHLELELQPGLNVLVGENDSGKTCVIDAVRLLVGTVTQDFFAPQESDFHIAQGTGEPVKWFKIQGEFRGLSPAEAGALLEYLSVEGEGEASQFLFRMWLTGSRDDAGLRGSARRRPISTELRAGPVEQGKTPEEEGRRVEGAAREMLRATYLKPLRDAVSEMAARRGSRLSAILRALPGMTEQDTCSIDPASPNCRPVTLVDIMRRAEYDLRQVDVISEATKKVNDEYLRHLSVGDDSLRGDISVHAHRLRDILERMELSRSDVAEGTTHGLGISNLLFIATELLALSPPDQCDPELPLLLMEEPEAHLEPQRQMRLIEFLRDRTKQSSESPRIQMQVILSTHSPNLASKVGVASLTVMSKGSAFPMGQAYTLLDQSDYQYLERFLDVTKSNMFFARGVLIVEGDAEALLLPVFADMIGRPLARYGVSIVNVGHTGLFRFARVFRRRNSPEFPVRVACLADRDIPPDEAKSMLSAGRETEGEWTDPRIAAHLASLREDDGGPVETKISPRWTFEYDLALTELAPYLHAAISLARRAKQPGRALPTGSEAWKIIKTAAAEYAGWNSENPKPEAMARHIYEPLCKGSASKAVTAQCLAHILTMRHCAPSWDVSRWKSVIPTYIVEAIEHATGLSGAARTG